MTELALPKWGHQPRARVIDPQGGNDPAIDEARKGPYGSTEQQRTPPPGRSAEQGPYNGDAQDGPSRGIDAARNRLTYIQPSQRRLVRQAIQDTLDRTADGSAQPCDERQAKEDKGKVRQDPPRDGRDRADEPPFGTKGTPLAARAYDIVYGSQCGPEGHRCDKCRNEEVQIGG